MKLITKPRFILILLFSLFIPVALGAPTVQTEEDITGTYSCRGEDPSSKTIYEGKGTLIKQGDRYEMLWNYSDGTNFKGSGILRNNVLSIIFAQNKKDRKRQVSGIGLQVYEVEGTHFKGNWIFLGSDVVGIENCTKVIEVNREKKEEVIKE